MATIDQALNMAIAHHRAGQLSQAEALYRQILLAVPAHADALNLLGTIAIQRGQHQAGIDLIRGAIASDPRQGTYYSNLGEAHRALGQLAEARECFAEALRLNPQTGEAHNNLGLVLQAEHQLAAARECFERAIQLQPESAEAHYNLSRLLLLQGDFAAGWREHPWRRRISGHPSQRLAAPAWNGETLAGKTLLLYAEQGLGDTLQFVRFAPQAAQRVGRVLLCVQKPLLRLLEVSGFQNLVTFDDALPDHDVQSSLADLPAIFGFGLQSLETKTPYLRADEGLVVQWQKRLDAVAGFKIGIAFQGNPQFPGDQFRSIPLSTYEPICRLPGVQLISLQKHSGCEQLDAWAERMRILRYDDLLDVEQGSFMDTAALIRSLDLVITSDTSIAHLAGALSAQTWVVLPQVPDWRWQLHRQDCDWYPTLRIFRQAERGQWTQPIALLAAELAKRLSAAQ